MSRVLAPFASDSARPLVPTGDTTATITQALHKIDILAHLKLKEGASRQLLSSGQRFTAGRPLGSVDMADPYRCTGASNVWTPRCIWPGHHRRLVVYQAFIASWDPVGAGQGAGLPGVRKRIEEQ